jgi:segregation and condensation protein A
MEYQFKINDFEGPLDLLLHLIKEQKVDIFEVSIYELCQQYIRFIEESKLINLEIASEYLVMACTLLEIKSKMLLPKPEVEIDDEYEENSRDQLIRRLIEYKRYKEVTQTLKDLNEERSMVYTKPLEDLTQYKNETDTIELPSGIEVYDLVKSLEKMYQRLKIQKPLNTTMERREISVEKRASSLLKQIKQTSQPKISLLNFVDIPEKGYLVITFLAALDLAKNQKIKITQDKNFEDIYVSEV